MALRREEWTLLILVILKIAFSLSEETCEKTSVCSCELSNGTKIDLKQVDETITGLKSADKSGLTFDWNPCAPFNLKKSYCNQEHVLVAQVGDEACYPAGTDDTSFSVKGTDIVITYGGITSGTGVAEAKRSTEITLQCDPTVTSKKGSWTEFKEENPEKKVSVYSATYTSSYACVTGTPSSGGLSTGSILLIIFFPLLLMYLIIGMLINRYGRGIQSVPELFPNHSFWADFPFLAKDGVVFTFCCIKGACSSLYRKCNKDEYAEI